MSRHIVENAALENEYAKNQVLMNGAKRRMHWFQIIMFFGNIVLSAFSIGYTYLWFSLHKTAFAFRVLFLADDMEGNVVHFPIFTVTLIVAPIFVLLCIIAVASVKGVYVNIIGAVSALLMLLCIVNAVVGFEPVKLTNTVAFAIIMALESGLSFFFVSAFSTMESLKGKEGYPDFNFNVSGVLTQEQQKYMDYYNARLEGKKVDSNKPSLPDEDVGVMGELETDDLKLPEESYERVDIRRMPL